MSKRERCIECGKPAGGESSDFCDDHWGILTNARHGRGLLIQKALKRSTPGSAAHLQAIVKATKLFVAHAAVKSKLDSLTPAERSAASKKSANTRGTDSMNQMRSAAATKESRAKAWQTRRARALLKDQQLKTVDRLNKPPKDPAL